MDYLCTSLLGKIDDNSAENDLRAIWQEYEDGLILESKYIYDVNKMELI